VGFTHLLKINNPLKGDIIMENTITKNTRTVGVCMKTYETYFMKVQIDNEIDDGDIDWEIIKDHFNQNSKFEVYKDQNDDEFFLKEVDGDNKQPDVSLVYETHRHLTKQIIGYVVPKNTRSVLEFESNNGRNGSMDRRLTVTLYLSGSKEDMRKLWDEGKIDELSQFNIIPEDDFIETKLDKDRHPHPPRDYGSLEVEVPDSYHPKYFKKIYKRKGSTNQITLTNVEDYMSKNISTNWEDNLTDNMVKWYEEKEKW